MEALAQGISSFLPGARVSAEGQMLEFPPSLLGRVLCPVKFKVTYLSGKKNTKDDALSQQFYPPELLWLKTLNGTGIVQFRIIYLCNADLSSAHSERFFVLVSHNKLISTHGTCHIYIYFMNTYDQFNCVV